MDDMYIQLQSKEMPIRGIEVDELERVCQENNIKFSNKTMRMDGAQNSALWSWITLYFSSQVIDKFAADMLSSAAYDLVKTAVRGIVNAIRAKVSGTNKLKKSSAIELKSPSATLRIESDDISDKMFSEAIDAFVKASEANASKDGHPVIQTFVVVDGNIKEMPQNEYITKYIAQKKEDAEGKRMDKLKMHTPNLADENFRKLAALFPNAVTETIDDDGKVVRAIDADVLRQEIATHVVEGREERYQFTWPDKRKAILTANAPINKTLRPCREESVGRDGAPGGFDSENLYIEGDNLEVLKLLQETYLGKIKMIYIDPPYNTGNDFVYEDDFAEEAGQYIAHSGQYDEEGNRLVQNTESNGRFHTDWLNMMYPRLRLAKDLLTNDGVIFISIDDNELDNLKKICSEIFGDSNFIAQITWEKRYTRSNNAKLFASLTDYILVYRKSISLSVLRESRSEKNDSIYTNPDNDPRGVWTSVSYVNPASRDQRPNLCYEIVNPYTGAVVSHPTNAWKYEYATYQQHIKENKLFWGKNGENQYPRLKKFLFEMDGGIVPANLWYYKEVGTTDAASKELEKLIGRGIFDFPKSIDLIIKMIDIAVKDGGIVLDFFSGSATSAHAVMQYNAKANSRCKFIMVQWPEETAETSEAYKAGYKNICEIGKERIRRAGAKIKADNPLTTQDLDVGFRVLKCDESNMKDVYYTPADTEQEQMDLLADNIKEDRTPEDLLFQVMLDMGVPLSSTIEITEIAGKKVFDVGGSPLRKFMLACFDKDVTEETVTAVAKLKPDYFVMRDSSMADDTVAANFEQIFRTYSPDTVRKVL